MKKYKWCLVPLLGIAFLLISLIIACDSAPTSVPPKQPPLAPVPESKPQPDSIPKPIVTPPIIKIVKPDLVIVDMWRSGLYWYYKIKNQGNADASATTTSVLFIDGQLEANDSVDPLATGAIRTEKFTHQYSCGFGWHNYKVRADILNAVNESNEENNVRIEYFNCP